MVIVNSIINFNSLLIFPFLVNVAFLPCLLYAVTSPTSLLSVLLFHVVFIDFLQSFALIASLSNLCTTVTYYFLYKHTQYLTVHKVSVFYDEHTMCLVSAQLRWSLNHLHCLMVLCFLSHLINISDKWMPISFILLPTLKLLVSFLIFYEVLLT